MAWARLLGNFSDCIERRGLMVSFGNASGSVTGVDLAILNQKARCLSRGQAGGSRANT